MEWRFREIRPDEVEKGVTQRDQFLNERLAIPDALIREAVQNSLDASFRRNQVTVSFSLRQLTSQGAKFLKDVFSAQLIHANAAGLDTSAINWTDHEILLVEDFGTTGLTGATEAKDEESFSDFWRRHGRSHKTGRNLGRHGLGKLVYSISSQLGAFFGVTLRRGDSRPYMLGQSVLNLHTHNGMEYDSHGFFSDFRDDGFQLPISDSPWVDDFCSNFYIDRSTEPGLSIVVPVPDSSLRSIDLLIETGIKNYFVPIVVGQLVLRFNDAEIKADTLRDMVHEYARDKITDADILFDFLEQSFTTPYEDHIVAKDTWWRDQKLAEDDFEEADLQRMQQQFSGGDVVAVRLNVPIRKRGEIEIEESYVTIYVQRTDEITDGQDFYVRGGLTLPDESKFGYRKAFGALFANDDPVNTFLGDAENASHSKWDYNSEKFRGHYVNGEAILRAVRNSVQKLHDLLAESADEEDSDALVDLFWLPVQEKRPKPKTKPVPDVPPPPPPPPKPKPIRVDEHPDGFALVPGDAVADTTLPIRGTLMAAYDVIGHNPFKFYSRFDFDLGEGGEIECVPKNIEVLSARNNILEFEISDPDFRLTLSGFDTDRQVKVNVRTET